MVPRSLAPSRNSLSTTDLTPDETNRWCRSRKGDLVCLAHDRRACLTSTRTVWKPFSQALLLRETPMYF